MYINKIKYLTSSKLFVADMSTGVTEDLLIGEIHYNKAGAEFIAARYYNALAPFLE